MSFDWYVYVLECEDQTLYTGVTKDPRRRLLEHQRGGCRYTRARRGRRMLRTLRCSKVRAYQYEWRLKRASRAQKLAWCRKTWRLSIRKPSQQACGRFQKAGRIA